MVEGSVRDYKGVSQQHPDNKRQRREATSRTHG